MEYQVANAQALALARSKVTSTLTHTLRKQLRPSQRSPTMALASLRVRRPPTEATLATLTFPKTRPRPRIRPYAMMTGVVLVSLGVFWHTCSVVVAPPRLQTQKRSWNGPLERTTLNMTGSQPISDDSICHHCWMHFPGSCDLDWCLVTLKGDKGALPNQDASVLLQLDSNRRLIGLFDGHGDEGHVASSTVVRDLPLRLASTLANAPRQTRLSRPKLVADMISNAFLQADASLLTLLRTSGTTAIVVYQEGLDVYIASAGDSTALLIAYEDGQATIIEQARHHKPADNDERARIVGLGGQVSIPTRREVQLGASSRVLLPGPPGSLGMALAMSRSLGDYDGKEPGFLTAEPTVKHVQLQEMGQYFVLAASDGLVDYLEPRSIAGDVGAALYGDQPLAQVCKTLIASAREEWADRTESTYRDDISIVVAKLT